MSATYHSSSIGAAGAAALALGALAGPALAAGESTASVAYTCSYRAVPPMPRRRPSTTLRRLPATMAVGQPLAPRPPSRSTPRPPASRRRLGWVVVQRHHRHEARLPRRPV